MTKTPKSATEHLSVAELLGDIPTYDQLPPGWANPRAIARIPIGEKVYIKNLRNRDWELGEVVEYWERGAFLQVRCARRSQKIFSPDNIAVRIPK